MEAVWIAVGMVILAGTALDALDTLISTRIRLARLWPTELFFRLSWPPVRWMCANIRSTRRRESVLALYGPLSIIALLTFWAAGQIVGWAFIWHGLHESFQPEQRSLLDSLYYSGVVYFSVGFGDVLPAAAPARMLTILESFGGLGTMGLVIGFLPSLYGAYQARERKLLRLDDLTDSRTTPVTLVRSVLEPDGDVARLDAFFDDWADWVAEIMETHSSFPMLMLFRSKFPGQSWVTALGVLTDGAVSALASLPDRDTRGAQRLYRLSVAAFGLLAERVHADLDPYERLPARLYSIGYSSMQTTGLELRPFDEAFTRVNDLREAFHPQMEALITAISSPRGFWGITSAEHMAEASIADLFDNEDK